VYFFVEDFREFLVAPLLQPVVAGIADNRQNPAAPVPAMKAIKGFEGAQVCLLHKVFRVVVIAGEPARQVVSRSKMRQQGCLKVRKSIWLRQPPVLPLP
jgi:hypothetical protein